MTKYEEIKDICNKIAEIFHPEKVILFGSYAKGTASEDSDVDLLVVLPKVKKEIDKAVEIRLSVRPSFPTDILVKSRKKIQSRIKMGDTFIKDIMNNGKVLYETNNS